MFTLEEQKDPLMTNLLGIRGVSGFIEMRTQRTFQLDYSQYIELIRASYNASNTLDCDYLTFSAFQYYCIVLLWKRLYFILSTRGTKTAASIMLDEILDFQLPVPLDIKLYLQGVGDLRDYSGNDFLLDVQGTQSSLFINGAQGSFGKLDVHNYIIYETLPSLIIALLKIRADMFEENVNWDLPSLLRPNCRNAIHPTRNLLGWWPTEPLIGNRRSIFIDSEITQYSFNVENVGFLPINKSLMRLVAQTLEKSKMPLDYMPSCRYGSIAQISFITRVPEDTKFDEMKNIAGKLGRTNSFIQMPGNIASASATFRYRMKRREINEFDMVSYMFVENDIPNDILRNENQIFEFGIGGKRWNKSEFCISEQEGRELITSFADRARKATS